MNTETSFWHPYADMGSVRHSELVIERAEDVWVWDADGKRYLDATAGLWYANVGPRQTRDPCRRRRPDGAPRCLLGVLRSRQPASAGARGGPRGARADAVEGVLRLRRQRRDRHRRQASPPLLVGARPARPHRPGQPHRRLSRHTRLRNRARRYPQQPAGLRTARRDGPGASRLARGHGADDSRGSVPSAWPPCSWSR